MLPGVLDAAAELERLIRHGRLDDDEIDEADHDVSDDGVDEILAVIDALVATGDRGLVPRARAALRTFLDDGNFYGRDLMAQLLAGLLGPEALPILLDASARDLGDDQDSLTTEILDLLKGHVSAARSVIIRYATDPDPARRRQGLWALGFVVDAADLDLLASAAVDPDPKIRSIALGSLGSLSADDRAFAVLVAGLNDFVPAVRTSAVSALGHSGRPEAVAPLVARVADPDDQVRRLLGNALGKLGDPAATPTLLALLRDRSSDVRRIAIGALGTVGGPVAFEHLVRLAADPDPELRGAAADALADVRGPVAVETLTRLAHDPEPYVRASVVVAVAVTPVPELAPLVVELADDPDSDVRARVAVALGRLGGPAAPEILQRYTADPAPNVRRVAENLLTRSRVSG